jgi:hypothetical protein
MPYILPCLLLLGGIAGVWLLLIRVFSRTMAAAYHVEIEKLDSGEGQRCLDVLDQTGLADESLLAANGFARDGVYRVRNSEGESQIIVWQHVRERTQLRVYLVHGRRLAMDVLTAFRVGQLRTSSDRNAQLIPPPPHGWIQSFGVTNASDLLALHKSAVECLRDATGQTPAEGPRDFATHFPKAMREFADFATSLVFWRLRLPYWFFMRRNLLHGKSVKQQLCGSDNA